MVLDSNICMQARLSRDIRFDGKFFTAVITTGIYCRPTCPAGPAKEENVRYYQSAAQAEFNGYQPCKRCKPELSPEHQLPSLLHQALTLVSIEPQLKVANIALRLRVSERHLQRLFKQNLGINPQQFINQKRRILARHLLLTSSLSLADVALISGFGSIRSFNQHIQEQYQITPTKMRKMSKANLRDHLQIKLPFQGQLNWQLMLNFFRARVIPGVEHVGDTYQRTINLDNSKGWIEVSAPKEQQHLLLDVYINDYSMVGDIIARVRKMFDLDSNLSVINKHLSKEATLKSIIRSNPGLRLPGCWDIFEFSIRAILGQQISVKAATTLAARIAHKFSNEDEGFDTLLPTGLSITFPTPEQLAMVSFAELGITDIRQQTLKTWLNFFQVNNQLFIDAHDSELFEKTLCQLKGIGPWTANYIAMRGLSLPDAFPAADLGIIKALAVNGEHLPIKKISDIAEQWRPWRSYAAIYLWQSLAAKPKPKSKQKK